MPKKSVFVVSSGCYSDYHIVGIYDTREQAEQLTAMVGDSNITELPLNPYLSELNKGLSVYFVKMLENGDTIEVRQQNPNDTLTGYDLISTTEPMDVWLDKLEHGQRVYTKRVFARDDRHAVKIANELRVQMLAQGKRR